MAFRDAILAPLDRVRAIGARLGLRVYTVKIRTRTWSGTRQGLGSNTDVDTPALNARLTISDGAIATGTSTLACAISTPFTSSDVGKVISVAGAGLTGTNLITTIAGFTASGAVTLAAPAASTVTVASVSYGYPVLVRQLTRSELLASGGLYAAQDLKVGPLTPAYTLPVPGGYADATIEPLVSNGTTEIFWLISGPQLPAVGGVFTQIGEEATALHTCIIVRKAPAAQ